MDLRYNPLSIEEDYYIPIRGTSNTDIVNLQGGQFTGTVDDEGAIADVAGQNNTLKDRTDDVDPATINAGDAVTLYFNYDASGKIKNGNLMIDLDSRWNVADSDTKDADGNFTGNVSVVNKSGGAELGAIVGVGHKITVPLTFMKAGQSFDGKYINYLILE